LKKINKSSLLLARARKRARRNVIMMIHIEISTDVTTPPINILMTNPMAIMQMSIIGICFNFNV
jgi:hypothetical protein